jgi:hypothetical protein
MEATATEPQDSAPHSQAEKMSAEEIERKSVSSAVADNDDAAFEESGDNGDGHINWTKRQVGAVISLSALWVGKTCPFHASRHKV